MDFVGGLAECLLIIFFTIFVFIFALLCALFVSILDYVFDIVGKKDLVFSDIYQKNWSKARASAENLCDDCYKFFIFPLIFIFFAFLIYRKYKLI